MNPDRRSGYSQNYELGHPRAAAGAHARNDSAMSNLAPRPSREMLAGVRDSHSGTSAAQNAVSKVPNADDFDPEAGWNVYSDFNNTGPRYSSLKTTSDGCVFVLWLYAIAEPEL